MQLNEASSTMAENGCDRKIVLLSFYNSFSSGKSELEHIPAQSPAISNTEEWTSVESHDHPTYSTTVHSGGLIMLTDWGRHNFF